MLLRSLCIIMLPFILGVKPQQTTTNNQVNKEQDPKATILDLLYHGKLDPAISLLNALSTDSPRYKHLLAAVKLQIMVHKEEWDDIIQFPLTPDLGIIEKSLVLIGKGMAFAHKQNMQQAIEQIRQINGLKSLKDYKNFQDEVDYSSLFLSGYLRLRQRKFHNTLRLFKRASKLERKLGNRNDYSWVYNALYFLGFTYQLTSRKHEAVATYKKVLRKWPHMTKAALKIKEISI